MGTHISRVKSVDLDAWTDEQLQSVVKWGNARSNKSVDLPVGLGLETGLLTDSSCTDTGRRNLRPVISRRKRECNSI